MIIIIVEEITILIMTVIPINAPRDLSHALSIARSILNRNSAGVKGIPLPSLRNNDTFNSSRSIGDINNNNNNQN